VRDHTAVVLEPPQHVVIDRRAVSVDQCVVDRVAERRSGASGCGRGLVAVEPAQNQRGQWHGTPAQRGHPYA